MEPVEAPIESPDPERTQDDDIHVRDPDPPDDLVDLATLPALQQFDGTEDQ